MAIVDTETREIEKYILVGRRAWGLGLSPDAQTLIVLNGLSDDFTMIDLEHQTSTTNQARGVSPPLDRGIQVRVRQLLTMLFAGFVSYASAATFHVVIVTASGAEPPTRGQSFAGIQTRVERPVQRGVELALFESTTSFEAYGVSPELKIIDLDNQRSIETQLTQIPEDALVILDLPKPEFSEVAALLNAADRVMINVRHPDTDLRDQMCLPSLYHTIPSERMYFDALGQFLIYRGWRKVLIVHGPTTRDKERTTILEKSLRKFGAEISDIRQFTLSHHPDDRDENKPEFLTGGASYDVVAVIDSERDFGRRIQYSTRRARPVVGDVGLSRWVGTAHWSATAHLS